MTDRVVLVGFMGAGKSTVGPLLAERLSFRFVDLDERVERRAGATVAEIFRERGEAAFRALEAEAARALDAETGIVVAAGGGWMARPELRDRWPGAVRVWLRVRPETAVERLAGRLASRPLLAARGSPADHGAAGGSPDRGGGGGAAGEAPDSGAGGAAGGTPDGSPRAVARRLLAAREEAYARAELTVETEGRTPEEVAEAVLRALRNLSPPSRLTGGARPPAPPASFSAAGGEEGAGAASERDPIRTHMEDDSR